MLIWMRNSAGAGVMKFLLMGLLVTAVFGLVLMDVGGFFNGNMSSNTLVKGGMVLLIGSPSLRRALFPGLLLILTVGFGTAYLLP